jgi:hypothetical protein
VKREVNKHCGLDFSFEERRGQLVMLTYEATQLTGLNSS